MFFKETVLILFVRPFSFGKSLDKGFIVEIIMQFALEINFPVKHQKDLKTMKGFKCRLPLPGFTVQLTK